MELLDISTEDLDKINQNLSLLNPTEDQEDLETRNEELLNLLGTAFNKRELKKAELQLKILSGMVSDVNYDTESEDSVTNDSDNFQKDYLSSSSEFDSISANFESAPEKEERQELDLKSSGEGFEEEEAPPPYNIEHNREMKSTNDSDTTNQANSVLGDVEISSNNPSEISPGDSDVKSELTEETNPLPAEMKKQEVAHESIEEQIPKEDFEENREVEVTRVEQKEEVNYVDQRKHESNQEHEINETADEDMHAESSSDGESVGSESETEAGKINHEILSGKEEPKLAPESAKRKREEEAEEYNNQENFEKETMSKDHPGVEPIEREEPYIYGDFEIPRKNTLEIDEALDQEMQTMKKEDAQEYLNVLTKLIYNSKTQTSELNEERQINDYSSEVAEPVGTPSDSVFSSSNLNDNIQTQDEVEASIPGEQTDLSMQNHQNIAGSSPNFVRVFENQSSPDEDNRKTLRNLQSELPSGWEVAISSNGKAYFVDHLTRTTNWKNPNSLPQFSFSKRKENFPISKSAAPQLKKLYAECQRIKEETNALQTEHQNGFQRLVERQKQLILSHFEEKSNELRAKQDIDLKKYLKDIKTLQKKKKKEFKSKYRRPSMEMAEDSNYPSAVKKFLTLHRKRDIREFKMAQKQEYLRKKYDKKMEDISILHQEQLKMFLQEVENGVQYLSNKHGEYRKDLYNLDKQLIIHLALIHELEQQELEKPQKKEWNQFRKQLPQQTKSSLKTFTKELKETKRCQKLQMRHADSELKKDLQKKYKQSNRELYIKFLDSQKKQALTQEEQLQKKHTNERKQLQSIQKQEAISLLVQTYRNQIYQLEKGTKEDHKYIQQLFVLLNKYLQRQRREKFALLKEYKEEVKQQFQENYSSQKALIENEYSKALAAFQKECQQQDRNSLKSFRKSKRNTESMKEAEEVYEKECLAAQIHREKWKLEQQIEKLRSLHAAELKLFQNKKNLIQVLFERELSLIQQVYTERKELEDFLFNVFWNLLEDIPKIMHVLLLNYRSILQSASIYPPPTNNTRQRLLETQHRQYQEKMGENLKQEEAAMKKQYSSEIAEFEQEIEILISQHQETESYLKKQLKEKEQAQVPTSS